MPSAEHEGIAGVTFESDGHRLLGTYMWIGFSLTEALALIGLVAPFIFKY